MECKVLLKEINFSMNISFITPEIAPVSDVSYKTRDHRIIWLGYALLLISFSLFVIFEFLNERQRSGSFAAFVVHYSLALTYVGVLLHQKMYGLKKSWMKKNISYTIILLHLFLISAYALNRDIHVFENSVNWLCCYIVLSSVVVLSFHYFDLLPGWINRIQYLLLGSAILFYGYLAIFVAEVYVIGGVGILFFGIGAHIFVPLVLLVSCGFLIRYSRRKKFISYGWIAIGFFASVFYTAGFVTEWTTRVSQIESLASQSVLYESDLPTWIKIGESVPSDWITERILKSDLVYTMHHESTGWQFFPSIRWAEARKHDPFVFISSLFKTNALSKEDRVKILQAISGSRHKAVERLWSGDNLTTSYIVSDIDIHPEFRLSYTEKYLNIRNDARAHGWWGSTEEAIYTFDLPEGSVITSLSLWVNGQESKGILTSKQKAVKAYKTIVGVERRDPSVVHWQEGNTVTVRVFPCTSEEERKFKIGITSPLVELHGKLRYQNAVFQGPNPHEVKETIRFRFLGDYSASEIPNDFTRDKNGDYVAEGEYNPDFEMLFDAGALRPDKKFVWDGFQYSIAKQEKQYATFNPARLFLDINKSWTPQELGKVKTFLKDKEVFAYNHDRFIKLTDDNWDLVDELALRNFSLFPFYLIKSPKDALVITKGDPLSPHLRDIKDSKFAAGIKSFFAKGEKVYVYNLSEKTSTYIKSLRELRAFEFSTGTSEELIKLLANHVYPKTTETENEVVLHDAGLVIKKQPAERAHTSNAPDHLVRLFAYNNIMRQVGSHYFTDDYSDARLVDEASTAYVVSPVSSLIVLESQHDYDRFDISNKEDSLRNASRQSSGAVPEPHEWLLIILFLLFAVIITYRKTQMKPVA